MIDSADIFFTIIPISTELVSPSVSYDMLADIEKDILFNLSSQKRKREFLSGRMAARQSIDSFNKSSNNIILNKGIDREEKGLPIWPTGIVGSISHSDTHAVCAIGSSDIFYGIGLDLLDTKRHTYKGLLSRICSVEEREALETHWDADLALLRSIVFSGKEAIYKFICSLRIPELQDYTFFWTDFSFKLIKEAEGKFIINVDFSNRLSSRLPEFMLRKKSQVQVIVKDELILSVCFLRI